eukprot:364631-Chlamydomonas_euryale.AAC.14
MIDNMYIAPAFASPQQSPLTWALDVHLQGRAAAATTWAAMRRAHLRTRATRCWLPSTKR